VCGIAGEVRPGGGDAALVASMCERLRHRGPDEGGHGEDGDAALGMRRLAVIGLGDGQQPISNESGSVRVVYNGEIYNYRELRTSLQARGHRFRTSTDTEVLVHLYEEHGDELVQHLRGMFAFALWDRERSRLLLVRDRVGKKPLLWTALPDGGIRFASELKALLADPAQQRRPDLSALDAYLTYGYVPAPLSALDGICKLEPGSLLVFDAHGVRTRRWWDLSYGGGTALRREEAVERTRELVREATRIRLVSERPLGAFLSGGIDSSLVVAAMAEAVSGPLQTFSIGFEDARYDERRYARIVSQRFGTQHTELVVRPDPVALLDELPRHYDEPFADSSAVPTLEVARLARQHVTVALTGDGGDESFGGYTRYSAMLAARLARPLAPLAPLVAAGLGRLPVRGGDVKHPVVRARRALDLLGGAPATRYSRLMSTFDETGRAALYAGELAEFARSGRRYDPLALAWQSSRADDLVDRLLDVDVRTYLPGDLLVKVDIATMAHSLEARSPLLDHELMEFAAGLPSAWKARGLQTKVLLKQAARGWLPDEVLDRPKMGFGIPVARWLREDLRDPVRDLLLDGTARSRGWFRTATVERLVAEHDAGADHAPRLWALLQLELWARRWLDDAAAPQAGDATAPIVAGDSG
jgi:asparagine synthase (glutamine-hydrolysing)